VVALLLLSYQCPLLLVHIQLPLVAVELERQQITREVLLALIRSLRTLYVSVVVLGLLLVESRMNYWLALVAVVIKTQGTGLAEALSHNKDSRAVMVFLVKQVELVVLVLVQQAQQ
jgi:hypothetical protein